MSTTESSLVVSNSLHSSLLEKVSQADVVKLREFFATWVPSPDAFDSLQDLMYHGFDPYDVYRNIIMKTESLLKEGVTHEEIKTDIFRAVAVGVIKGTVSDKNFNGLTEKGRDIINHLITRFGIIQKIDKKKRREGITFARFAAALPVQSVMISQTVGRSFSGPFGSADLPSIFFTQAFASCIPHSSEVSNSLLAIVNAFSCDQTFNLKGMQFSKFTAVEQISLWGNQFGFVRTAFVSPLLSQEERMSAMIFFGVKKHFTIINKVLLHNNQTEIDLEDWDKEFASWEALSTGGHRAEKDLPKMKEMISAVGKRGITAGGIEFPTKMSVVARITLPHYREYEDMAIDCFENPDLVETKDGIAWEKYGQNDDCSDIDTRDKIESVRAEYTIGMGSIDETWLRDRLSNPEQCVEILQKLLDSKSIESSLKVQMGDEEGNLGQWLYSCRVTKSLIPATIQKMTVSDYVVLNYLSVIRAILTDEYKRMHTAAYWWSSPVRRQKVRARLGIKL